MLISEEILNFQNISIHTDTVTIDEKDRLIAFKNNIDSIYTINSKNN